MTGAAERWLRLATALTASNGLDLTGAGMCSAATNALRVTGASIVLMSAGGNPGSIFASAPMVENLEGVQFTLGVGPTAEAYRWGVPVIETDLAGGRPQRWMGFVGPAADAGIGAVFSFPLQIGAASIGVLTLYQGHRGPLGDDTYADAMVLAGILTRAILAMQAGASEDVVAAGLCPASSSNAEIHQASGMVSVQLDIGVGEALGRLRARAFVEGRTVDEVAIEVVRRRIRFER